MGGTPASAASSSSCCPSWRAACCSSRRCFKPLLLVGCGGWQAKRTGFVSSLLWVLLADHSGMNGRPGSVMRPHQPAAVLSLIHMAWDVCAAMLHPALRDEVSDVGHQLQSHAWWHTLFIGGGAEAVLLLPGRACQTNQLTSSLAARYLASSRGCSSARPSPSTKAASLRAPCRTSRAGRRLQAAKADHTMTSSTPAPGSAHLWCLL